MKSAISPPHREKNGRKQRPSAAEIAAAQKEAEANALHQVVGLVLNQPHRMGDNDQRLHCALGRMCKRLKLRDELYRAGDEYAALVRRWLIAIGGIRPEGHKASGNSQEEITREIADKLTARLDEADAVLKRSGAYPWVRHICVDYPSQNVSELPPIAGAKARQGLFDLAVHFGMLKPYERG